MPFPITRLATAMAVASLPLLAAVPAADAKRPVIRTCASVVVRPNLATAQGPVKVLRAATNIKARRVSCRTTRRLVGSMILQVAAVPQTWPDERSWWTQAGWSVAKARDPTAREGGTFAVQRRGGYRIWFTLWY
ncbi:hypothetical protein SK069_17375 [Patulibacter brassicae]|jgi:hypothetical protein|uniref:Uncharacterized protein n=1 Tax=Patulibacter brassicae TaxID=1705717 RepID=A0ABU4VNE1_9ACTN|nr:hypothetical protein [Patulibacter brassicae]MDX8153373.1 hypothetical protein [Patulibacter brassicae]